MARLQVQGFITRRASRKKLMARPLGHMLASHTNARHPEGWRLLPTGRKNPENRRFPAIFS